MASIGLTVKVFLGFEYECPGGGHRFMAASPDKPMARAASASNPGTAALRDAASKVLNHDMPLYMACPCRQSSSGATTSSSSSPSSRAHPARLSRLHVVTPKAPLHVVLNPRVQPCPDGPIFHPAWVGSGPPAPRKLPHNSVLVLRLPYVYCGKRAS